MLTPAPLRTAVAVLLLLLPPPVFVGAQNSYSKRATRAHSYFPEPQVESVGERVKAKIALSPALAGMDIKVEVKNGIVTLTGTVSSKAKKRLAAKIARSVAGAANVVNHIKVGRLIPLDYRCCCNGECWYQSRPCPFCDTNRAQCAREYAADIKDAQTPEERRAARQKFYECVHKQY